MMPPQTAFDISASDAVSTRPSGGSRIKIVALISLGFVALVVIAQCDNGLTPFVTTMSRGAVQAVANAVIGLRKVVPKGQDGNKEADKRHQPYLPGQPEQQTDDYVLPWPPLPLGKTWVPLATDKRHQPVNFLPRAVKEPVPWPQTEANEMLWHEMFNEAQPDARCCDSPRDKIEKPDELDAQ